MLMVLGIPRYGDVMHVSPCVGIVIEGRWACQSLCGHCNRESMGVGAQLCLIAGMADRR